MIRANIQLYILFFINKQIGVCKDKDNVDVLAPFITELFNRSLSSGVFPTQFKAAYRGGAPIGAGGS